MSLKRARQMSARERVREACFTRDSYTCQASARDILQGIECWGRLECNELIRRSQWSGGWLEVNNTVSLCTAHHQWVTEHSEEAHEVGLLRWSWERAAAE